MDSQVAVLIPAVRDALCDEVAEVREAAARAFNTLQTRIGNEAIARVVPSLLTAVATAPTPEQAAHAMAGLQNLVAIRTAEVLPFLLPRLLEAPISPFNARTLAAVAATASGTIHNHMYAIVPALLACLAGEEPRAPAGEAGGAAAPVA